MQAHETVIVRELLPDDAEGARVVAQRAQKALRAVYRPTAELARANEMRVDNGHQLVAAHGRQIVGTVLYDQRGDKLHLQSLAVDPAWQRRGIGRALIARAVELARSRGASRLSLYTVVETGNVPVFERLGFRVVCTEPACGLEPVGTAAINEAYMEMKIAPLSSSCMADETAESAAQTSGMSEEISVREIREADAEGFLDLLIRIEAETDFMLLEAGERATTVGEQRERIKGILSKENQTILVASRAEQLVGYVVAIGGEFRRIRHRAHVVAGVLQAFTSRQIGTRLFTALQIWARRHGIERLELTVRSDNERGTGLYRKMGFEIEGLKRRSLNIKGTYVNEYYMAKILD